MSLEFEKLKPAAEKLKLTDAEKADIISACGETPVRTKKRRFAPYIAAAAALIVVITAAVPVLFGRMGNKSADTANAAENDYYYSADTADENMPEMQKEKAVYILPPEFAVLVPEGTIEVSEEIVPDEASMADFVVQFGITKEAFEKANNEYAERTGAGFDTETVFALAEEYGKKGE